MSALPAKIGKYQIKGIAGQGAMATVYVAYDPVIDRTVAIKVSKIPATLEEDVEARQQQKLFFNEAQTAGALDHPNILRIYDANYEQGLSYIAMEYVEQARTLKVYTESSTLLPVEQAVKLIRQCTDALVYAHGKGVTHRDIKPANIMLTSNDVVKLGDFGISQRANSDQTQVMGWFGSPLYMSPEQARGGDLTGQSDIFSLGVVSYQLLTGKTPFAARDIPVVINNILKKDPEPVEALRPEVPKRLAAIVKRCLQKDQVLRYQRAVDLGAELETLANEINDPQLALPQEEKVRIARSLKFCKTLSAMEVSDLVKTSVWESYYPGACILQQGAIGAAFYILVSGEVAIQKDRKDIAVLREGECFGEIGYLTEGRRSATVVATQATTVMKISAPVRDWASLPTQLRLGKVFQQLLIERLIESGRALAKALP